MPENRLSSNRINLDEGQHYRASNGWWDARTHTVLLVLGSLNSTVSRFANHHRDNTHTNCLLRAAIYERFHRMTVDFYWHTEWRIHVRVRLVI